MKIVVFLLLITSQAMAQLIELPNGNPIIKNKFTADPAAMVSNGKIYIYTGHDEAPNREQRYVMNDWLVFSSSDMKTWTEHPVPLKVTDFTWAKGDAWASQTIERNGKFYWYVAVEHGTISGKSIGVAVADNPIGPFKDAKGSAIITNDMTNHHAIVDFKGKSYFVYHNGALSPDAASFHRSVCVDELKYNLDGTIQKIVMTSEGVKAVK